MLTGFVHGAIQLILDPSALSYLSGALICAAGIFDVTSVFGTLQNAETGAFDITGIVNTNWIAVAAVSGAAILISIIFCAIWRITNQKKA